MTLRAAALSLLVAGSYLAYPGYSLAGTASVNAGTLTYVADAGETNSVTLQAVNGGTTAEFWLLIDHDAPVVAGAGCTPYLFGWVGHAVDCGKPNVAHAFLLDLADRLGVASPHQNLPVVVEGGDGADSLTGGSLGDSLDGGAGNDSLDGLLGSDTVGGGAGNDTINAASCVSFPCGPDAADTYAGGDGVDSVTYHPRVASVTVTLDGVADDGAGGEGDNVATDVENVTGGLRGDVIVGSDGVNVLDAGSYEGVGPPDSVDGGAGDDLLNGGLGCCAALNGGAGDDGLFGSLAGGGALDGGSGDDTLAPQFGGIPPPFTVAGGAGVDTVSFSGAFSGISVSLDDVANDGPGPGNVHSDIENVIGGLGNDSIVGDDDANVLDGGLGADTMRGGGGRDTVTYATRFQPVHAELGAASGVQGEGDFIGDDIERVVGGSNGDVLIGGVGDEDLFGGAGNDVLDGGLGSDLLDAGVGDGDVVDYSGRLADLAIDLSDEGDDGEAEEDDTLRGFEEVWSGAGDDALFGGPADEVFDGGAGTDVIGGGGGYDLVDYSIRDEDVFADLDGEVGDDGEDGEADTLGSDLEGIWGGAGDDELSGNDSDNLLAGGPGDDLVDGGLGSDELTGGAGFDIADYAGHAIQVFLDLDSQVGDDGAAGEADTIETAEGLIGGSANDVLNGNDGDNELYGGPGVDQLEGRGGDDLVNGGTGSDSLSGGAGFDLSDYAGRLNGVSVDLDGAPEDDGEPGERDTTLGDIEDVAGGAGNDTLVGDGAENFLFGRGGGDSLDGAGGSDALFGGDGDDSLVSRDDAFDENDCGAGGADHAIMDWFDEVVACEQALGPAPHAATGGATEITETAARLAGAVNPLWNATSVHWEYGPTTAYGMRTPSINLPANALSHQVSAVVSGLSSGTTYHYRVAATNGGGTTYGTDLTLTTLGVALPPPRNPAPPPPFRGCTVARVVGQPLAKARRLITRRRCRVGKVTRRSSRVVRKGIVLAQRPRAGRRLPRGSKVSLVVSSGKPRKRAPRRR